MGTRNVPPFRNDVEEASCVHKSFMKRAAIWKQAKSQLPNFAKSKTKKSRNLSPRKSKMVSMP